MAVVIVVVMDAAIAPVSNDVRPAKAGASCMRAGALYGDMDLTLDGLLHCGQQIHLQLFVLCQRVATHLESNDEDDKGRRVCLWIHGDDSSDLLRVDQKSVRRAFDRLRRARYISFACRR